MSFLNVLWIFFILRDIEVSGTLRKKLLIVNLQRVKTKFKKIKA